MYVTLVRRRAALLQDIEDDLVNMSLDPRMMPGVAEMHMARSSASTPSLRSREGSVTPGGGATGDKGGNVRVVVRVRGFLPRGKVCL